MGNLEGQNWKNITGNLPIWYGGEIEADNENLYFCNYEEGVWRASLSSILSDDEKLTENIDLSLTASPNPCIDNIVFSFQLPDQEDVRLNIYNASAYLIKQLIDDELEKGKHFFQYDASHLEAGVYFAVISTAKNKQTIKLVKTAPY